MSRYFHFEFFKRKSFIFAVLFLLSLNSYSKVFLGGEFTHSSINFKGVKTTLLSPTVTAGFSISESSVFEASYRNFNFSSSSPSGTTYEAVSFRESLATGGFRFVAAPVSFRIGGGYWDTTTERPLGGAASRQQNSSAVGYAGLALYFSVLENIVLYTDYSYYYGGKQLNIHSISAGMRTFLF